MHALAERVGPARQLDLPGPAVLYRAPAHARRSAARSEDRRRAALAAPAFDDRWDDLAALPRPSSADRHRAPRAPLLAPDGCLVLHVDPEDEPLREGVCDEIFGARLLRERNHLALSALAGQDARTSSASTTSSCATCATPPTLAEVPSALRAPRGVDPRDVGRQETARGRGRRWAAGPIEQHRGDDAGHAAGRRLGDRHRRADRPRAHRLPDAEARGAARAPRSSACTDADDLVLDPYAGQRHDAGGRGALGRRVIGIDSSPEAVRVARKRLWAGVSSPFGERVVGDTPGPAKARPRPGGTGGLSRRSRRGMIRPPAAPRFCLPSGARVELDGPPAELGGAFARELAGVGLASRPATARGSGSAELPLADLHTLRAILRRLGRVRGAGGVDTMHKLSTRAAREALCTARAWAIPRRRAR